MTALTSWQSAQDRAALRDDRGAGQPRRSSAKAEPLRSHHPGRVNHTIPYSWAGHNTDSEQRTDPGRSRVEDRSGHWTVSGPRTAAPRMDLTVLKRPCQADQHRHRQAETALGLWLHVCVHHTKTSQKTFLSVSQAPLGCPLTPTHPMTARGYLDHSARRRIRLIGPTGHAIDRLEDLFT